MFHSSNTPLTPLNRADADGDSTMHSSPELDADDEMFPDEGPSTPRNAATFALDPASELSPPNSQGPSNVPRDDNFSAALAATPSVINANGKRTHQAASGAAGKESGTLHTDSVTGYQWFKQDDQPGFEWKNNRAREDEARALELIVDRSLQIKSQ